MVTLNYNLTKQDYVSFSLQVRWASPEKKGKAIKNYLLKALSYGGILVIVRLAGREPLLNVYFIYSLSLVLFIFIAPIFQMKQIFERTLGSLVNNPLNANMLTETLVSFAETGVITKDNLHETKYQWACFVKKEETNHCYFLYLNSEQAILVPKRAFKNEADKQQLEKLFSEHLSFDAEVGHLVKE